MPTCTRWVDTGNGERSAIWGAELGGNYKSLEVRQWWAGGFRFYVNGEFRGERPTRREAQKAAREHANADFWN